MFITALAHNFITKFVFGSLTILFVLLSLGNYTENVTLLHIASYEGIICGLSAVYSALGQLINESFARKVIPL